MLHKESEVAELQRIAEKMNKLPPEALERVWQFMQKLQNERTEKEDTECR